MEGRECASVSSPLNAVLAAAGGVGRRRSSDQAKHEIACPVLVLANMVPHYGADDAIHARDKLESGSNVLEMDLPEGGRRRVERAEKTCERGWNISFQSDATDVSVMSKLGASRLIVVVSNLAHEHGTRSRVFKHKDVAMV